MNWRWFCQHNLIYPTWHMSSVEDIPDYYTCACGQWKQLTLWGRYGIGGDTYGA